MASTEATQPDILPSITSEKPETKISETNEPIPIADATEQDSPTIQQVPFPYPSSAAKLPEPAELTEEQVTKYNSVLNIVKSWSHIPCKAAANNLDEPIADSERMWLTRDC